MFGTTSACCAFAFEDRLRAHQSFCDYAAAGPAQATLLMAGVAGHGVSAAMLTGIVKAAFDASRADAYEPRAIVGRIADGVHKFECQR
jgi:hypothetical protein